MLGYMDDSHAGRQGISRVVILGAGPAGLTAAFELCRAGVACVVLERDEAVGGLAKTVKYKGYRFDLGGHRFFTRIERVKTMWETLLGADFLVRPRRSRILYRNRFLHYPLRPFDALVKLGPLPCAGFLASYLRAWWRPIEPERTFEDWVSNRFGRRLYRALFKPYSEKVWGIPCTEMSADWAAQRIRGLSLAVAVKDALLGFLAREKAESLIDEFHYPRLGCGMLWELVADRLAECGCEVRCGHGVTRLDWTGGRITAAGVANADGREISVPGSHFLSSLALRELVRAMNPPAPRTVRAAAERLGYRALILVVLIVDRAEVFADNWLYVHEEGIRVARIQNFKNWSPAMVPDPAKTCLALEYFCSQEDDLWRSSDADLERLAARELERLGLARRADVVEATVARVPQAYPVYDVDYRLHLDTVLGFLSGFANLQLIGRNGTHSYVNQDRAMHSAMLAVDGLLGAAPESGRAGWQTLNAYVDGELSAAESAEVARALADDPALVDQVASLMRLKAAVQDSIE